MKDHEIAELVNEVTKQVKRVCPDAPQCLREVISRPIVEALKPKVGTIKETYIHGKLVSRENT
jgi:hypothetical protein